MATHTTLNNGTLSLWASTTPTASKRDQDVRDQDRIELSVKVKEGLKDDALKCAMDLGRDVVVAPDGVLRIA